MTWFTSDTHFGHAAILTHGRYIFDSVENMDAVLIKNWNDRVGLRDDIYHLGDFNFRSTRTTAEYLGELRGRIHLIEGNHDPKYALRYRQLFASVQPVKYLKLDGKRITLYHYAQRVWRGSNLGSWHLYGHSHGGIPDLGRSMDVGVDAQSFAPIEFAQVREALKDRPFTYHHPDMEIECVCDGGPQGEGLVSIPHAVHCPMSKEER